MGQIDDFLREVDRAIREEARETSYMFPIRPDVTQAGYEAAKTSGHLRQAGWVFVDDITPDDVEKIMAIDVNAGLLAVGFQKVRQYLSAGLVPLLDDEGQTFYKEREQLTLADREAFHRYWEDNAPEPSELEGDYTLLWPPENNQKESMD